MLWNNRAKLCLIVTFIYVNLNCCCLQLNPAVFRIGPLSIVSSKLPLHLHSSQNLMTIETLLMNVLPRIGQQLTATVVAWISLYSVFLIYAYMFQIQKNIIGFGYASLFFLMTYFYRVPTYQRSSSSFKIKFN